ncbi:hypothetical protein B0H13DRAFT_1850462 [Mycena leptocephala]|nr:hypothetical protein B0H13DRAFT_1850462 [Mycena leptocephala]
MSIPLEAQCVPQWVDMAGTVLAVPSECGVYPSPSVCLNGNMDQRVPRSAEFSSIPAASPSLTPAQDSRKSAISLREIQARSPLPSAVLILILSQKSIRLILPGGLAES